MKPTNNSGNLLALAQDEPPLRELEQELTAAVADGFFFYERNAHAFDTRFAFWEGQSPDGRKHSTANRAAFPWEDASDTRVRVVDMIINEQVALLMQAYDQMTIQATPTKSGDAQWCAKVKAVMRWFLYTKMADEARGEIELLANYVLTYGSAILSPTWLTSLAYEMHEVTIQEIRDAALQKGGPQMLVQVAEMLFSDDKREQLVELVAHLSPLITKGDARSIVNTLRKSATCEFPMPYIRENRPQYTALACFQDVYFPISTTRMQNARWIAQRELLTEAELRAKAEGRDAWDADFVEEVLNYKGDQWNTNAWAMNLVERQRELGGLWGNFLDETKDLYEVWHFHYRATKKGFPAIFKTVMHPKIEKLWGQHGILEYQHGQYPYIDFTRERHSRTILSSRGLPEIGDTHQSEIKVQRDARVDRTSVTVMPPIKVNTRRGKVKLAFGPGTEIPVTNQTDLEVMDFGAPDSTSNEVELSTRRDLYEYVGRNFEGVDPSVVTAAKTALVGRFLSGMKGVLTQTLQLAQQYMPDVEIMRVVGDLAKPFQVSREDIQGQFDLQMEWDPRHSDSNYVFELLENLQKYILPIDHNATVDWNEIIRYALAAVNPTLADLAVRPADSADQSEIADEKNNIALAWSGQEPPMKLQGQNFALRMQVIQNAIQQNPLMNQKLQQNPDFQAILEARMKFLQMQVMQQQNRQIGVLGTKPALSPTPAGGPPQLGQFGPPAPPPPQTLALGGFGQ